MNFSKLDQLMDSMPHRGIPGSELVVTHHGKEIYSRVSGIARQADQTPVSSDTLWWIYSASKISTCVSAMQLVEQGKLNLDDPVSKYLPSFAKLTVSTPEGVQECKCPMKIIHLFTMTGGLDYDAEDPARREALAQNLSTVAVADSLAKKPLCFEPGSRYQYSFCHDALGAVVCVVSGLSLTEYMRRNLWAPLGMEDTGFFPSNEQKRRIADMYEYNDRLNVAMPMEFEAPYPKSSFESGGAGLFSRAKDYIKLMTALSLGGVSPDGKRILKESTVKMLRINRLSDACREGTFAGRLYGYGWGLCGRVHMDPLVSLSPSSVGEFGWDGAAAAYALADPDEELAIYFGTHVMNCLYAYNWLHPHIRNAVYEAIRG